MPFVRRQIEEGDPLTCYRKLQPILFYDLAQVAGQFVQVLGRLFRLPFAGQVLRRRLVDVTHGQPDLLDARALLLSPGHHLRRRLCRRIHQAVRWIAQLGGFLGRKSDGEPGVTTLWRGRQRLQDIAATWYLVNEQARLVSNR